MQEDINHILGIYLGADENGGYQPIWRDERLQQAFPEDYAQMLLLIRPYLDEDQEPDWSRGTLIQETDRFAEMLREKFPELDAVSVQALANRWSFGHK